MTMGLRTQLSSSSSLLVSAKAVCRAGSATLAGHVKMWTAGVRVGVAGLGATSFAGVCRVAGVRAAVSEAPTARVGAVDTDGLPVKALMEALEAAGRRGAEVSFWKLIDKTVSNFTVYELSCMNVCRIRCNLHHNGLSKLLVSRELNSFE